MVVYGIFIRMATFFSPYLQETLSNTKLDLQHSPDTFGAKVSLTI